MKPKEFLEKYGPIVARSTQGTGIFPSVKLAQMALESGWGEHMAGNNAFGIKATGGQPRVTASTLEEVSGRMVKMDQPFRKYESLEESIADHTAFLMKNPRYRSAGVFTAKTPAEQATALQKAGYATDSQYARKLQSIIAKWGFEALDRTPGEQPPEPAAGAPLALEPISPIQANTLQAPAGHAPQSPARAFVPATEGMDPQRAMELAQDPLLAGEPQWVARAFPVKKP